MDDYDKPGTYCWSFMDIHPPKNLFLFDRLGIEGFKFFIVYITTAKLLTNYFMISKNVNLNQIKN